MLIPVLWRDANGRYLVPGWHRNPAKSPALQPNGLASWINTATDAWQALTGQVAKARMAAAPERQDLTFQDADQPILILPHPDELAEYLPLVQDILVIPLAMADDGPPPPPDELVEVDPDWTGYALAVTKQLDQGLLELYHRKSPSELIDEMVRAGGCDLHLHTTASDGSDTPDELFARVRANRLLSFAVTDHDVMTSLDRITALVSAACHESSGHQMDEHGDQSDFCPVFIPGVEISVSESRELHILGLFPCGGHRKLDDFLGQQRQARHRRNIAMVEQLRNLGYDVTLDELVDKGTGVVGRMQAAQLLTERGYTLSTRDAFDRVLGFGKPGYIERPRPSMAETIWQIRRCGGVPVLAHPAVYHWCSEKPVVSERLLHHLTDAKTKGLLGVEAFHGEASLAACQEISAAARFLGLVRTCGSDDHGRNKTTTSIYNRKTSFLTEREILVVGALIQTRLEDGQTRYLLARRSTEGHGLGQWELPGGKVEPGEEPVAALQREIREELGVDSVIGPLVKLLTHPYDGFRIILACFDVRLENRPLTLTAHDRIEWKTASQALEMDLLAADIALFEELSVVEV